MSCRSNPILVDRKAEEIVARVDPHPVPRYDLDVPDVIALRREVRAETGTYRMLGYSVADPAWAS